MTMPAQALPADDAAEDGQLRAALSGGFITLRHLPTATETDFRRHCQARATVLLRKAIYGLIGLYFLVVGPIFVFSRDADIRLWELYAMLPIGLVLAALWGCTRIRALDDYVEAIIGLCLFICLSGTLYCAMRLAGAYFGQIAAYETIYILIVVFTILQLPVRIAATAALLAFTVSLLAALGGRLSPSWQDMLLYFLVPLLICMVTGYILEFSERRNFVQTLLLNRESQRLVRLHAEAEENARQQRYAADYLALISGNLSLKELFTRTLRFLTEHTGAQVGVAYHLSSRGTLRRVATWAVDADTLDDKKEIAPEATLMGPALRSGEVMQLQNVRADYLPLNLGMGMLPCAHLLVLPIVQGGKPLAVLELGRVTPFDASAQDKAEAIRTHLGYAVTAANAREIALKATTA